MPGQYSGMINDQHRSQFRLPYPLYERLKAAAEAQKRSLNAEIVTRLEASFETGGDTVERLAQILGERDARLLEEIKATVQELIGQKSRGK